MSSGNVIVLSAVSSETAKTYWWSAEVSCISSVLGRVTVPVNVGPDKGARVVSAAASVQPLIVGRFVNSASTDQIFVNFQAPVAHNEPVIVRLFAPKAKSQPAKVSVFAECVKVTSAVDGAVDQVITEPEPKNKSDQAIAAVPKASVLSVSETRVVLIATEARLSKAVVAPLLVTVAQTNCPGSSSHIKNLSLPGSAGNIVSAPPTAWDEA